MVKFKDLYEIADGDIASLDIEGDDKTYWRDGSISRYLGMVDGKRKIEHSKLNEPFESFLKKYFECEVTYIQGELDGNGIHVTIREVKNEPEFDFDFKWINETLYITKGKKILGKVSKEQLLEACKKVDKDIAKQLDELLGGSNV